MRRPYKGRLEWNFLFKSATIYNYKVVMSLKSRIITSTSHVFKDASGLTDLILLL